MVADECRVQHEPNAVYHWSLKGQTPIIRVNRDKRNHISIYGALSLKSKRVTSHYCRKQCSEETVKFFEKIKIRKEKLCNKAEADLPILLFLDNARWHKSKEIRQWLGENPGIVELVNFPPYSPECNPQEKVWRALKKHLAKLRLHECSFDEVVIEIKSFLKINKFDYKFI